MEKAATARRGLRTSGRQQRASMLCTTPAPPPTRCRVQRLRPALPRCCAQRPHRPTPEKRESAGMRPERTTESAPLRDVTLLHTCKAPSIGLHSDNLRRTRAKTLIQHQSARNGWRQDSALRASALNASPANQRAHKGTAPAPRRKAKEGGREKSAKPTRATPRAKRRRAGPGLEPNGHGGSHETRANMARDETDGGGRGPTPEKRASAGTRPAPQPRAPLRKPVHPYTHTHM